MLASAPKQRKMNVPKSEEFKETSSGRDVDNFLWGMERYFHAMGIKDNPTKVNIGPVYFIDVALLWWRRRSIDKKLGGTVIRTWMELQNEFKKQFYLQYVDEEA